MVGPVGQEPAHLRQRAFGQRGFDLVAPTGELSGCLWPTEQQRVDAQRGSKAGVALPTAVPDGAFPRVEGRVAHTDGPHARQVHDAQEMPLQPVAGEPPP